MTIEFFVPGLPAPGGSKRAFVIPKTGRVVVVEDARRNKDWRASVAHGAFEAMKEADSPPFEGPLDVRLSFQMPRPKAHYTSKGGVRPTAPNFHTNKPDCLKLARSTEDAMTGIVWLDDKQIARERLEKRYSDGFAGCQVTVRHLQDGE